MTHPASEPHREPEATPHRDAAPGTGPAPAPDPAPTSAPGPAADPEPSAPPLGAMNGVDQALQKHSWIEDVWGMLTGTFLASLGLYLLREALAVTGGTAGLGLLLSYASDIPVAVMFPLVNIPFFALALWKKGWSFTLRTIIAVLLVSALTLLHPVMLAGVDVDPVYGTFTGNLLAGVGLLILFRHRSSLGGINILALLVQERLGWSAGYVQMGIDVLIIVAALMVSPWPSVLLSAAGAVVLNLILALNHRPGRYTGY
ncbi:uncharacterized membrane-anchored protein YitT (DUF2179 family) [Brevibacterium pityocampae]